MKRAFISFAVMCFFLNGIANAQVLRIATGDLTGLFYPVGGAIAKIYNQSSKRARMYVEPTSGSAFNVQSVLKGDYDFAIVQGDTAYSAFKGIGDWRPDVGKNLRAICVLYSETITLVAAADSGIRTLAELKGKKVGIGHSGSGSHRNARDVIVASGLKANKDVTVYPIRTYQAINKVHSGELDAFFYTVGHPNKNIMRATKHSRKIHFVPIEHLGGLIQKYPFYSHAQIPQHLYPHAAKNRKIASASEALENSQTHIPSIGIPTLLVTRAETPDELVEALTKQIFTHISQLRELHPALLWITQRSMASGIPIPIHKGAQSYFRDAGLR